MGAAGLALGAYGCFNVVGAAFVFMTVRPHLEATDNLPPPDFLFQLFGLNLGLGVLGVVLLIFAIRGIIARIEAGLPGEDEGVGSTPAGRFVSVLLYGAGFCFAAFSLAVSIVPGAQTALLVATGTTVEAQVTGLDPTDDPRQWIIHYSYEAGGRTIEGTIPGTFRDEFERERRKTLEIAYEPANPDRHQVTENYGHADFAWFVLTRVLVLMVGLWGLTRNLAPMPPPRAEEPARGERAPTRFMVEEPAPEPRPRAVSAEPGARRTFGRRGA